MVKSSRLPESNVLLGWEVSSVISLDFSTSYFISLYL